MPLRVSRRLLAVERTRQANLQLGIALTVVAGATNAGGYLAVHQYTSHMTGIVSAMADNLVLGSTGIALLGLIAVIAFMSGAASTAILVNFARRAHLRSRFALPLLIEAVLLAGFAVLGDRFLHGGRHVVFTITGLCFVMGLQNALISKISHAEIRTTHLTGMITDIGIELGKLAYWNHAVLTDEPAVTADRRRLTALTSLVGGFFGGALLGAYGFSHFGYITALPFAMLLLFIAAAPILDDLRNGFSRLIADH